MIFSETWRFLLDQNVPSSVGRFLVENKQDVLWSRDVVGPEAKDPIVATYAISERRILVSWDRDFGQQRFMAPRFRDLSRIGFSVPEPLAVDRFLEVSDLVDFLLRRHKQIPPEIKISSDKVTVRDKTQN